MEIIVIITSSQTHNNIDHLQSTRGGVDCHCALIESLKAYAKLFAIYWDRYVIA